LKMISIYRTRTGGEGFRKDRDGDVELTSDIGKKYVTFDSN